MGKYAYPKKMEAALKLLYNYKLVSAENWHTTQLDIKGLSFLRKYKVEKEKSASEKDPRWIKAMSVEILNNTRLQESIGKNTVLSSKRKIVHNWRWFIISMLW